VTGLNRLDVDDFESGDPAERGAVFRASSVGSSRFGSARIRHCITQHALAETVSGKRDKLSWTAESGEVRFCALMENDGDGGLLRWPLQLMRPTAGTR